MPDPAAEIAKLRARVAELERTVRALSEPSKDARNALLERFLRMSDASLEAIVLHDQGVILDVNEACAALFDWPVEAAVGRHVLEFVPPEARETILRAIQTGSEAPYESLGQRRDGTVFPVEGIGRAIRYEDRVVRASVIRDITERKKAEAALLASQDLTRRIIDSVPGGVVQVDADGKIQTANAEAVRVLGITQDDTQQLHVADYATKVIRSDGSDCPVTELPVSRCLATGQAQPSLELGVRRPNGSLSWAVYRAVPLVDPQSGATSGAVVTFFDITERKLAEQALAEVQHVLEERVQERTSELETEKQLLRHLLDAHERDQKLTAYEIHDGIVQDVAGSLMHLDALEDSVPATVWQEMKTPLRLLRRAIGEARRLISGLRPPIIDEQGVVAAIDYLVREERSTGLNLTLDVDARFDRLSPLLESSVFRIVQESITNIRRHSKTQRAAVSLVQHDHHLEIEVRDWGVGFDPAQTNEQRFGLRGIRERARLLGGDAQIESLPGKGTTVRVMLPL